MISSEELKKILIENNLLSEVKFNDYLTEAKESKVTLKNLLIMKKVVSERDLVKLYGKEIGIPYIDLADIQIDKKVLENLPEKIARKYNTIVFKEEDGRFCLAMSDPEDIQAIQFIKKKFGNNLNIYITSQADIDLIVDQYKAGFSEEISKAIQENKEIAIEEEELEDTATIDTVKEIVQEAPIARAVKIILEYAVKSRASDVHIEPRETFIQVRYRIDGVLRDTMTLPRQIMSSIVTRVKILSNLRIDEHRIPQDGRIKLNLAGKNISIRVSTLPVMDGEKVVMRILDESAKAASLEELGFRGLALSVVKRNIHRPHGMTLVTGPTGSGKSTTLYSLLTLLNDIGVNISTVEDPVEYRVPGVNQTQINPGVGMTFASGLRALLRQDPDVIMVGEIRDKETAEMAVHASLTGHVVLSTLHTNSAVGSLPRLEDMSVEPFLIASTVNNVIGQRLVRKLCPDCKQQYSLDHKVLERLICDFGLREEFLKIENIQKEKKKLTNLGLETKDISGLANLIGKKSIIQILSEKSILMDRTSPHNGQEVRQGLFTEIDPKTCRLDLKSIDAYKLELYKPVGCNKCEQTGYKGRLGIYEVVEVTDEIGSLIIRKASEDELTSAAKKNGFINMYQDGFTKVLSGITSIEELVRVAQE